MFPALHWLSVDQDVKQEVVPLHRNGAHETAGAAVQVPKPSHIAAGVAWLVVALQVRAAQDVPSTRSRQPPEPSHIPSRPQGFCASPESKVCRGRFRTFADFEREPTNRDELDFGRPPRNLQRESSIDFSFSR
jgi:hypothetical protein